MTCGRRLGHFWSSLEGDSTPRTNQPANQSSCQQTNQPTNIMWWGLTTLSRLNSWSRLFAKPKYCCLCENCLCIFLDDLSQQILQNLIIVDKQEHQGDMTNFGIGPFISINIRRNFIYEDAFEKLSPENGETIRNCFK